MTGRGRTADLSLQGGEAERTLGDCRLQLPGKEDFTSIRLPKSEQLDYRRLHDAGASEMRRVTAPCIPLGFSGAWGVNLERESKG